jgi:hypothetical protein
VCSHFLSMSPSGRSEPIPKNINQASRTNAFLLNFVRSWTLGLTNDVVVVSLSNQRLPGLAAFVEIPSDERQMIELRPFTKNAVELRSSHCYWLSSYC